MSVIEKEDATLKANIRAGNVRRFNMQRILFVLTLSANHFGICLLYFLNDNLLINLLDFLIFLVVVWFVNLSIFYIFLVRKLEKIQTPILTISLIYWIGLSIIFSAYFLEYHRLSAMFLLLGLMLIGAFRISVPTFILFVISFIVGYVFVFYSALVNRPIQTDTTVEIIELVMFFLVTIGLWVTVLRIVALQKSLRKQKVDLNMALSHVQELAITDELSGLYNRRKIMELLTDQVNLAELGNYQFTVCYIDLDFFKQVNDSYGHNVGDEVIKRFSIVSRNSIRSIDSIGRFGGEEFLVICIDASLDDSLFVAERIRANIEQEKFSEMSGQNVTISAGVAQYIKGEGIESLLARADKKLYMAKDAGRNQVSS